MANLSDLEKDRLNETAIKNILLRKDTVHKQSRYKTWQDSVLGNSLFQSGFLMKQYVRI